MDAFFASIEERDNPALKGIPVAVGRDERRGVVSTANYEARKFGVGSAMPVYKAKELCPHITFAPPRMEAYREASKKIREILLTYTELVEFASIDEAYMDVTDNNMTSMEVAIALKADIKRIVGVTASVGISINKFLAKTASDLDKPDGITEIEERSVPAFLLDLPIEKFRGIGKKTAPKMWERGIHNGSHLLDLSMEDMVDIFGQRRAGWFYNIARGIDDRPVSIEPRERKSIGVSETFSHDICFDKDAWSELKKLALEIIHRQELYGLYGRTITVKIKYNDFTIHTRAMTGMNGIRRYDHILKVCVRLLRKKPLIKPVRLFGISMSNFDTNEYQL